MLRLADALDCREDRLPPEDHRILPQIPQESQEYWKHEIVERIEIKGIEIYVEMLLKYKDHKENNVADKVKEEIENVRAVIREEIKNAFDEGKINFYLIADAVLSAPDINMLFFA